MRNYKNELDVDFIGNPKPLTREEENAVSGYIKAQKLKQAKAKTRKLKHHPVNQPA